VDGGGGGGVEADCDAMPGLLDAAVMMSLAPNRTLVRAH
jgi:hypothetical protein